MEKETVLKFEDIYTHIKTPNENYKDDDKINKRLLSETNLESDGNYFLECLSCCCFFLYT